MSVKNRVVAIVLAVMIAASACSNANVRKQGTYTVHTYPEGPCHACHRGSGEFGGSEALVAVGKQLCFRCHALPKDEKYVHDAVKIWGCTVCHNPHGSSYQYLLRDPAPKLCFGCHVEADVLNMDAHKAPLQKCLVCHDAHMSDKRFLLR
jgi:predicted CXXCH cytochrome family protein